MPPKKSRKTSRPQPKRRQKPQPQRKRPRPQRSFLDSALSVGGRLLSKVVGLGNYSSRDVFKRNSILGMGNMPPTVATSKIKSTIITHKEYIMDVISSTNANTQLILGTNLFAFPIQPASSTTFPWLSTVAQNYQEYRLLGMAFEFKSTCGSAVSSTNNAMGSVLMSTQYRSSAPQFLTKQQMDNEQYSTDVVPWTNACHYIECAPHESPLTTLYVSSSSLNANESPELFSIGTMYLATCGQQASSVVLGELWCTYQIELIKPQLSLGSSADTGSVLSTHIALLGPTAAAPFTGATIRSGSNIPIGFGSPTIMSITPYTFNTGDVISIYYGVNGTAATIATSTFTLANLTNTSFLANNTSSRLVTPSDGGSSTSYAVQWVLRVTNGAALSSIMFSGTGTFPSAATGDIIITQLNSNFT